MKKLCKVFEDVLNCVFAEQINESLKRQRDINAWEMGLEALKKRDFEFVWAHDRSGLSGTLPNENGQEVHWHQWAEETNGFSEKEISQQITVLHENKPEPLYFRQKLLLLVLGR
jgi:hypothetical protein